MPAQSRHASYRWYVLPPDVSKAAAARLPGVVAGLEYVSTDQDCHVVTSDIVRTVSVLDAMMVV